MFMQFGRFEVSEGFEKKELPAEWTENLTRTLTDVYFQRSEKDNRFFNVYAEILEKEFVVIISYLHHNDQLVAPIALSISHDLVEDSKKFRVALDNLVNFSGVIFDDIFATEDWLDYVSAWTESKSKSSTFYYKISRENISLTLQAEEILKKEGNI
jgi:hypothetical protein